MDSESYSNSDSCGGKKSSSGEVLTKRARSIYFSDALKRALIQSCPESKLLKQYKSSLSCGKIIKVLDGKITSRYCGFRHCITCNRIKTGQNINNYEYSLKNELKQPFFVTLTIPNCLEIDLRREIIKMHQVFSTFVKNRNQYFERNSIKQTIQGIRKTEVTYNKNRNDYHPHFHIIIDTREEAENLKKYWLKRYPLALDYLQDIQECKEGFEKEIFKYVTKVLPSKKRHESQENYYQRLERDIDIYSIDVIMVSLSKLRSIQSFGISSADKEEEGEMELSAKIYDQEIEPGNYIYSHSEKNWINQETGELLLKEIVINNKLERITKILTKFYEGKDPPT